MHLWGTKFSAWDHHDLNYRWILGKGHRKQLVYSLSVALEQIISMLNKATHICCKVSEGQKYRSGLTGWFYSGSFTSWVKVLTGGWWGWRTNLQAHSRGCWQEASVALCKAAPNIAAGSVLNKWWEREEGGRGEAKVPKTEPPSFITESWKTHPFCFILMVTQTHYSPVREGAAW